MTKTLKVPFNRSYWVVPSKLLAGGYPGSNDPIEEERNLAGLIQAGVRHVISLLEPQEYGHPDAPFAPYVDPMESIAKRMGVTVTFDQLSIRDFSIPTERRMVRILNQIDMCLKYNKPVYVHCWGGKGRTGTVVGCYLVRHGFAAGKDVMVMIKALRENTEDFSDPSPETGDQIKMVINWRKDLK
jgi:Swiss Army Knife protein, DSP-PTPase phosphatase domain